MEENTIKNNRRFLISLLTLVIFCLSFVPVKQVHASSDIPFIILNRYSNTIKIGDEFYLYAFTSNGKKPTFKSSSSSIASVNTYGKITGKKAGTVTITAKIRNAEASCKVTVSKTTITLNTRVVSLENGTDFKLSASTSNNSIVTWKSSKSSVASVNENGLITAKKPGTATITAKANQTITTCKVTVKYPTITLSKSYLTMFRKNTVRLTASVSSDITPKWKSNKKSVATVDQKGNVTAIKHGIAVISVTVDGVTKSCEVTVTSPTIVLSAASINLKIGNSINIIASVSSKNNPTWKSSNVNVASVNKNGRVTAKKKGKAIIYASEDGAKSSCIVIVE